MEKLRRGTEIFVLLLFCMSSVFFVSRVFSYSTNITHPTLIDKMAELYNQNFDPDLTAEQISWMKQGSVDEDMPPRWMNHFFDPVNNKGLRGIYMTAKDWAKDPESQSDYALGDFSWQRAILDYREGNIRHAFLSLGHVLHLLSDINVPAHTRDDIHISGDSYEQFLKVNGVKWNGDSVEFFGDLEDAFVKLANYANNNFYSDSTIESDRYNIIEVHSYETENGFLVAKDHDGRNLYFVNRLSDWNILPGIKSLSANVVLNDYADHLLPQVISSGAGVIDLFFSEVKNGGDFILPAQKNAKEKVSYAFGFLVKKVNELFGKFKEPDKFVVQAGEEPGYALIGKPNNESVQEDDEVIVEQNNQEEPGSGSLPTQEDIEEVSGGLKEIEEVDQEYLEEVVEEEIESNDGPVNFVYPLPLSFEPPNNESVQSGTGTESSVASQENNSSSSVENTQSSSPGGGTVVQGQTEEPQHSIDNSPTSTESLDGQDEESVESENIESSEDLVIDIVSSSIGTYAQILDVVISEVAWAGTASDKSTDEWIELYNNTDEQINLSGWKILVSDRVIELTGTMSSFGYFLLERTDDSALVGVDADQIFTLRGGLKNAGEHLQLIDAGDQIIDKVDCTTGWFSGDAEGYRSMRRVSTTLGGSYPLNWEYGNGQKPHDPSFSYQPPIEEKEEDVVVEEHEEQEPDVGMENPVVDNPPTSTKEYTIEDDQDESEETDSSIDPDSVDNPVGGYSGYQPSFTILTSVQSEKERVLTKDNNPYILQYNYIVPVGKILRIEPGVVVKAYSRDSYFDIRGYMIANGTSSLPITLTSGRDTSFESARLNRVVGTQGTGQAEAGDWQGIKLQPAAQLVLSGVHMRYAGAEFIVGNKKYQHAIKADTADLLIDGSSLVNNGELSILSSFSTTTIKDSVFDSGEIAVKTDGGSVLIENLEFSNFSGEKGPVVVENLWPQVENIRFTSNTFDGLWISGALVVGDEKIGDGWPVALQNVKILPSASLTIDSGSHIFMPLASSLEVEGRLDANGTFDRPIRVETMEGVSNWGYWLFKNSISHLSFVNFLGGNYLPTKPKKRDGVLIIEDSSVVLNHCSIINGRAPGNSILSTESNLTIYSTWIGHTEEPLFETSGVRIKGGTLILDNVWFSNLEYGIYGLTGDMGLPFLEMYNMNPDHFINIENLWSPNYWLSPLLSMPEIIINN